MIKRYVLRLEAEERQRLEIFTSSGCRSAQLVRRARALLLADVSELGPGWTDARIAEATGITVRSIEMLRRRCVLEGVDACLRRREPRYQSIRHKLDGEKEAKLVALSCSAPPPGRTRWTLRLLAGRLVELHVVDSVSYETVRRTLKKNDLKPWRRKMWCIPPKQNGAFVAAMENVLEVYKRPYDSLHPVICMDEGAKQLTAETRAPIPMTSGQPLRFDYEYTRNGMYQAFEPHEARRLLDRLELVHTPKHGSWLNVAEIELSALGRQCTEGRIDNFETLQQLVSQWEQARNNKKTAIDWQFKTEDARIRLKQLYPKLAA